MICDVQTYLTNIMANNMILLRSINVIAAYNESVQ